MSRTTRRKPAAAVAEHNTDSLAMLKRIAELLPSAGQDATWPDAGSAEHVRERLAEILAFLEGDESDLPQCAHVCKRCANNWDPRTYTKCPKCSGIAWYAGQTMPPRECSSKWVDEDGNCFDANCAKHKEAS